jgi:hypothetical protein
MEGFYSQRYYTTVVRKGGDAAGYHHPVSIMYITMYILGGRAVKGADADEVLFVG